MLFTFLGYQHMYRDNSWVDPCQDQGLAWMDFNKFGKITGLESEAE